MNTKRITRTVAVALACMLSMATANAQSLSSEQVNARMKTSRAVDAVI